MGINWCAIGQHRCTSTQSTSCHWYFSTAVKVYHSHKLCRNVPFHNSCGNASGISPSYEGCGNVVSNFLNQVQECQNLALILWMVPSHSYNCFTFQWNKNHLIICCVSFITNLELRQKVFDIFTSSVGGGGFPIFVTWSLPWLYWLSLRLFLISRGSSFPIKQTRDDIPNYSIWLSIHHCFCQTPGFSQRLGTRP